MNFIPPLTSLRFFAAAAVAIFHLQGAFGYQTGNINFAPAITFFFVLSGFVLTYVYEDFSEPGSIARYYASRFARIWPLHLVTALYFLWAVHVPSWDVVVLNLLLLQTWSMEVATAMSMNGVSWSISVEMFFYLVLPAVILTRRFWPLWLAGAIAVVALGVVMATVSGAPWSLTDASWLAFLQIGPPARFLEFLAGVLTAFFFRRNRDVKLPAAVWTVLEILVLAGAAYVSQIQPFISLYVTYLPSALAHWLCYSSTFPMMSLVVLCFAYSGGAVSRVLSLKGFVFLGNASFAIYMVHQLVLVTWLVNGWAPNAWNPVALCLVYAQIAFVSVLSYLLLEKPARSAIVAAFARITSRRKRLHPGKQAAVA